ncbi:DNA-formamidopyrimidine glycosylase [Candidatus Izemoplasma sp. B36]|uniref:DNA-formamidopyrimidine glycosylase n=1 Tax=Candidatus Izemoplasma sp. B36 TaxID=3242468 RepID=UPI0035580777
MPELPEVETVKETLKNFIIGKKIIDVIVNYDKIVKSPSVETFVKKITNQTFTDIRRYGKYLLFDLEKNTLVSHLRMEGKYYIRDSVTEFTKHEHIIFKLDNNKYLTYHDVRKFGTMELVELHKENDLESIKVLGKEINDPDLNVSYLYPLIKKSSRPIKSLLLDQHIVTGLGNIYVDETLFLAKIHPRKIGNELSYYQIEKIIKSAKKVIDKAISLGGTTIRTYQSTLGVDGRFQNELNVHTLVGKKCKVCNDVVQKIRVGGRGTYLCPRCQRENFPLIIGLTGGISSGKSLVSNMFSDKNICVIDADKIYKTLLKTNKIMYNKLVSGFGNSIVKDNNINLRTLGNIVYNSSEKREKLNKITHPFILEEMKNRVLKAKEQCKKMIVLDVPLLFETKIDHMVNLIMSVYVNYDTQVNRLMIRDNIDSKQAEAKIKSQMDIKTKKYLADIVIDNNNDIANTQKQFNEIYNRLRSDGFVN